MTFRSSLIEPFLNLGKPVIAAVNGYCLGGGMEILYACTLAVAAEGARFAQPEVNLGFNPLAGATQQLPLLVGRKKAMEILLLGEMFDAAEALRLGIIDEVVPASTLMERVREVATRLAARPRLAVRYIMDCVWQAGYLTLDQGLDLEAKCYTICCTSPDVIQGLEAFFRNGGSVTRIRVSQRDRYREEGGSYASAESKTSMHQRLTRWRGISLSSSPETW